jgi:3-hydroxybutyryl-CoA dehydratase
MMGNMGFTNLHLFFDDVCVGQEWKSLGRTVTESDLVNFAGLSGDFNPMHVNHEFARTTVFGKPIAHGLLVMSLGSGLSLWAPPMRTLAFMSVREWHFREPVFVADTIHSVTKVREMEPRSRGRRGVITWERRILNQHDKVVQEGITLTLVEGRGGKKDAAS